MKKIIFILLLASIGVGAVKFIVPINDFARENLPEEVLELIGEEPKSFLEKLLD